MMHVKLYEYNMTSNIEDRETLLIDITDDKVIYNDKVLTDMDLIDEIDDLLFIYKDSLLNIKNIAHTNYKTGRQKQLAIANPEISDKPIMMYGNTDEEEIAVFYEGFKNQLIILLNSYMAN